MDPAAWSVGLWIGSTVQDARLAVRGLVRTPGPTLIALVTMTLCIGANTTVFSVVQTVLLQPLPYTDPGRIVEIMETHPNRGWTISFSHPNFWDMWERNDSFTYLAAHASTGMNLTGAEQAERLSGGVVSVDFFRVLGIEPVIGRNFQAGEDQAGSDHRVVLLGNNFWRRRFGGDSSLVGQSILLDNESYTVIGVLPRAEPFPGQTDIFVPLIRGSNTHRSDHRLSVIGHLRPDVTFEAAISDLEGIAEGIGNLDEDGPLGISATPSSDWIAEPQLRVALWVLMGAVGFLLLIACVNVTNLLLVRAAGRRRESAICSALGASQGRLVRRLVAESMILCLTGAGLGIALASQAVRIVKTSGLDGSIPRLMSVGINEWVLGFTVFIALVTGVVAGILPGLQVGRSGLVALLRDGDRGTTGSRRQRRTRGVLVAAETALSMVLLVGAGLMVRSFSKLQGVDTGFDSENRLSLQVSLPRGYGAERTHMFLEQSIHRIRSVPRVLAAGGVNVRPIVGGSVGMGMVPMEHVGDQSAVVWVDWRLVTPDYFRTMGLTIHSGRSFTERDRRTDPDEVIVSEPLADRLWPNESPVGRRAALWADPDQKAEVVGVVSGMRERGPDAGATMVVYFPYYGFLSGSVTIVVHTLGDPEPVVPAIRGILHELDPEVPISNIGTLDELVNHSVSGNRFNMLLLTVFAIVALILALTGIYGVLSFSVARRSSEMGLRIALGAKRSAVLRQIIKQGMQPVLVGVVFGYAGAFGLSRYLTTLLFEITPTDPRTFATVAGLLLASALVACFVPARKALRVDPSVALASD